MERKVEEKFLISLEVGVAGRFLGNYGPRYFFKTNTNDLSEASRWVRADIKGTNPIFPRDMKKRGVD